MTLYDPKLSHFDIDLKRGAQGELWVKDVARMLAEGCGEIEVKTDAKFVATNNLYIEYECKGRDGIWRPSGIAVTKAKLWAFRLGKHPMLLVFDTELVKDAARVSFRCGLTAECKYGDNPTKGALVSLDSLFDRREKSLDEH